MAIPAGQDGTNKGPTEKAMQRGAKKTAEGVQAGVTAGAAFAEAQQQHIKAGQAARDRVQDIEFHPPKVPGGYRGKVGK